MRNREPWVVAHERFSPDVRLQRQDGSLLTWTYVIEHLSEDVLNESNLSQTIFIDCWKIPFTPSRDLAGQCRAHFDNGGRSYTEKTRLTESRINLKRDILLRIYIPTKNYEADYTILVVR